jgi:glycosyltransferase involved in cell wall biosynthesis
LAWYDSFMLLKSKLFELIGRVCTKRQVLLSHSGPFGKAHIVMMLSSGNPTMAGGVPAQVMTRARYLQSEGFTVTVIARGNQSWHGNHVIEGINVLAVWPKDFRQGKQIEKMWFHPLLGICQLKVLKDIQKQIPIDIVFVFDSQCGWAATTFKKQFDCFTMFTIQGTALMPAALPNILRKSSIRWECNTYRRVDLVLPASLTLLDEYRRAFGEPGRYEVLYNAISDDFQPIDRGNRAIRRFGFVGRLEEDKRPLAMIEATKTFSLPRDVSLRLVGEGSLREKILSEIENHPFSNQISISKGFVANRTELIAEYSQMDCLVWSAAVEGLGVAPTEAMATGLPVIGPETVPGRELLCDDYEAIAKLDDYEQIGELMQRMMAEPDLVERCRKRGFEIAAKFRPEVSLPRLRDVCVEGLPQTLQEKFINAYLN